MKVRSILCAVIAVLMLAVIMSGCSLIGVSEEKEVVSSTETVIGEPEENTEEEITEPEPVIEAYVYSHDGHSVGQSVEMPARIDGEMENVAAEHIEMFDGLVVMDKISEFVHISEGADEFFYREADMIDGELTAAFNLNYTPDDRTELWIDKARTNLANYYGSVEEKTVIVDDVEGILFELAYPSDGSNRKCSTCYIDLAGGLLYVTIDYTSANEDVGEMIRAMFGSISFPTV